MARKRTIDPNFWTSEPISRLSREKRLFVLGMISNADDEGYLKGSGAWLKATIFPYDNDVKPSDLEKWRQEVVHTETIRSCKIRGETIIWFPKWYEYQYVEKAKVSLLRALVERCGKRGCLKKNDHGNITEQSPPIPKKPLFFTSTDTDKKRTEEGERPESETVGQNEPGSYKIFATRYYAVAGRHPGRQKRLVEGYGKLCERFGEPVVLAALDEWASGRGGSDRLKSNQFAPKDFLFTEGAEICEGKKQAQEMGADQVEEGVRELDIPE